MQVVVGHVGNDDGAAIGEMSDRARGLHRRAQEVAVLARRIALRRVHGPVANGALGVHDHQVGAMHQRLQRGDERLRGVERAGGITGGGRVSPGPRGIEIRAQRYVPADTKTDGIACG